MVVGVRIHRSASASERMFGSAWPGKSADDNLTDDSSGSGSDHERGGPGQRAGRPKQQPPPSRKKFTRSISSISLPPPPQDAGEYLDKRVMTPLQERVNALTMLPGALYTAHFVLSGRWVGTGDKEWADIAPETLSDESGWFGAGCLRSDAFPKLTAMPPPALVAAAFGVLVHAPFSFLYHWIAARIEPSRRVRHWSRRLDHAFIHFAAIAFSYATSGARDYALLNAAFNLESACRQFEEKVHPRRNVGRIAASISLYLLPVLVYGHFLLFMKFVLLFGLGGWCFVGYPFGGWSHSIFHLSLAFLPHLVMTAAMELESSQLQSSFAAQCASNQ
ncbi:hypothetical protein ACHAWF_014775 [Thalassiosira exigua]